MRSTSEAPGLPHRKLMVTEIGSLNPFIFTVYGAQISPDGSAVAYLSEGQLHLRRLDELESRVATDSTFESGVIWSPDSQWVVYPAGRTLWKISATSAVVFLGFQPPEEGAERDFVSFMNRTTEGIDNVILVYSSGEMHLDV